MTPSSCTCLLHALCSGHITPYRPFMHRMRRFLRLSRKQVAEQTDISLRDFTRWEQGKIALPASTVRLVAGLYEALLETLRHDETWLSEVQKQELIDLLIDITVGKAVSHD